jgi:DNA polymerase alpha subunit B
MFGLVYQADRIGLLAVMAALDGVLEAHATLQIVMVPSLRDAHHQYVYPQPPFHKKKASEALSSPDHAKRVHMMANPCTFSVNNIVCGVSALDIIMHLSSNELYRYVAICMYAIQSVGMGLME